MKIFFRIPGEPKAKARPRVTRNGTFTPKETRIFEEKVRNCFLVQNNTRELEGPLRASIICQYNKPKSWSKKKKAETIYKTSKPDCDNLAKSIFDSLNGIAYHDDSQIVEMQVKKEYTDGEPGTAVFIETINPENAKEA